MGLNLGRRRRVVETYNPATGTRTMLGLEADEVECNTCQVCGGRIQVMIYRNSGFCSQNCARR